MKVQHPPSMLSGWLQPRRYKTMFINLVNSETDPFCNYNFASPDEPDLHFLLKALRSAIIM